MGHVINGDDISTDSEKIDSIVKFPTPKKVKDVRAFLGLTGYYRRFSPNYSKTITTLLKLLKKGHKWIWEDKHQVCLLYTSRCV